jgi:hypothetical protein
LCAFRAIATDRGSAAALFCAFRAIATDGGSAAASVARPDGSCGVTGLSSSSRCSILGAKPDRGRFCTPGATKAAEGSGGGCPGWSGGGCTEGSCGCFSGFGGAERGGFSGVGGAERGGFSGVGGAERGGSGCFLFCGRRRFCGARNMRALRSGEVRGNFAP